MIDKILQQVFFLTRDGVIFSGEFVVNHLLLSFEHDKYLLTVLVLKECSTEVSYAADRSYASYQAPVFPLSITIQNINH